MYNKRYKGVDGRTYVLEPNMRPLPLRTKLYPRYGVVYELMSATELWRIENFFADKKSKKFDRDRIITEYELHKDETARRWLGNEAAVFQKLCDKFPEAAAYKSYRDVQYAVKYHCNKNGEIITKSMKEEN